MMKVLANNCVSKLRIPKGVKHADGIAYNPVLDLYVTMNSEDGISVWSPVTGKVVANCDFGFDGYLDMLLLPGNRIGVSYWELYSGGSVEIYSLEKDTFVSPELDVGVPPLHYAAEVALSPQKSLLLAAAPEVDHGVFEVCIDWDNLKVLKVRELCIPEGYEVGGFCCSSDSVYVLVGQENDDVDGLTMRRFDCEWEEQANQGIEEEDEQEYNVEKIEPQEEVTISYYILDGKDEKIDRCCGLVHDGENLIIANGEKIVLLDSVTEGSNAHLIASGLYPIIELNLNHKGQLIVQVFNDLKLFEYKCSPRSLQDLCRCFILETIPTCCSEKVNCLPIPSRLKDYLLYK